MLIQNMEHLTVENLEIVNAANPGSERNGLRLVLNDYGEGNGYTIRNRDIHDVQGGDAKALGGSSGIHVSVTGGKTPSWYNDLNISNNKIHDVDREGIYFKSTWNKRPEVGRQDYTGLGPWTPSTRVVVEKNDLNSIAGDGINIDTTQDAVIRNNKLTGFQLRSKEANAGIWTFNADDTVISSNDVSGGGNTKDGMSFDSDGGSQRTVFEYNYSHDNKGGLLLLCPYSGAFTHGTVMRYNISHNDGERIFQLCPGDIAGTEIYNNTIINDSITPARFLQDDNSVKRGITWRNNIVVNRGDAMTIDHRGPGFSFDHNLLLGVGAVPANADGTSNPGGTSNNPGLLDTDRLPAGIEDLSGFGLRTGSPALGTGTLITNNGGRDFFGNHVSDSKAPNMGAYQGKGIKDNAHPASIDLANRRFTTPSHTPFTVNGQLQWWLSVTITPLYDSLAAAFNRVAVTNDSDTSGVWSITYTDGSSVNYTLSAGDFYYNQAAPGNTAFAVMNYRNIPAGMDRRTVTIFESTIAVDQAKTVAYITLPNTPSQVDAKSPGIYVLAMGLGQ